MLFYATLLGAAVHLDCKQSVGAQRKLLWYKVQPMQLANEKLNQPSEAASDQILQLRGGIQSLGMRGMVKNWLDICYGPWSGGWEYGRIF